MIPPVRVLPDQRTVAGTQVAGRPGRGPHLGTVKQAGCLTPDPDPS